VICVPALFVDAELRTGATLSIVTERPDEVVVAPPIVAIAVIVCVVEESVPAVHDQAPVVVLAVHVFPVFTPSL
jgi:predicted aconitase with swiveling domain